MNQMGATLGKVEIFPGMDNPQETELQKTIFRDGEEGYFLISSEMEISSILRAIATQATRICIHYDNDQRFATTSAIGLDELGMWLDPSWFPQDDHPLLTGSSITFVSMHQHVKIQFDAPGLIHSHFRSRNAFYLPWPEQVFRIQRRESFRSPLPPSSKANCTIPIHLGNMDGTTAMRTAPLVDISNGGIRLLCGENETALLPDRTFANCRLSLPETDPLTVTLEVRNSSYFVSPDNSIQKRVGCRFVNLGNHTNIQLQRHITRLEGENRSKRRRG